MKISKKWLKIAEVYKIFAKGNNLDFSEKAAEELFNFESKGIGNIKLDCFVSTNNGYAVGKKLMDITVAMWKEELKTGLISREELYTDKFPHWWLDKVLNKASKLYDTNLKVL